MKLNEIYIRDPFIYVENDTCYMVGTTDVSCWGGKAKGFYGYKSTDLENFDGPYELFKQTNKFWADENYWAPELFKYNGKYYIIASFKKEGVCRASQILVSDTPFGKYRPLNEKLTPSEWECLDATIFEENNELYTVFSHEWTQCSNGEIVAAKLNKDTLLIEGKPVVLFKATSAEWVVSHNGKDYVTDGPFLYKLKSGKLLMLWSSFGKEGYALGMAISSNGIMGPWAHIDKPLFPHNGGHGMVFKFKNKLYVSLHYPNEPHLTERACFYRVREIEDRLVLCDE